MRAFLFLPALLLTTPAMAAPDGAALFAQNCSACHQANGEGIEGAFPKLAGDAFVNGDPKAVAATILNGRGGMPAFKDQLKDDELAAIVSHVRSHWGNNAPAISAETFAAVRTGVAAAPAKPVPGH